MATCRHVRALGALAVGLVLVVPSPLLAHVSRAPQGQAGSLLVSAAWLAEHRADPWLVILHVGSRAGYDAGHIPGARFLPLEAVSTPRGQGLTLDLPPVAELEATFEKVGVTDRSQIVLSFEGDLITPATRVFFTLDYLGLGDRTALVDGGLNAWRAAGQPVTTDLPTVIPGSFTPHPKPAVVVDAEWVLAHLEQPGVALVDARPPESFSGLKPGNMPRAGHIPGARNVADTTLFDEGGRLKDADTLRTLFRGAGANPGDQVVTYCFIGQRASAVYFAARYLGYDVRLYDGSWEDWSRRPELPVVGPATPVPIKK